MKQLASRLPPLFEVRRTTIGPGSARMTGAADWVGALVVVEEGLVEVECTRGTRRTFVTGDVLCLSWLPLRALRNPGDRPAVLVSVSRRRLPMYRERHRPGRR